MTAGGSDYDVTRSTLMLDPAARIDPPNTYIRVVVDIRRDEQRLLSLSAIPGREHCPGVRHPRRRRRIATGPASSTRWTPEAWDRPGWYWNEEVPTERRRNSIDGSCDPAEFTPIEHGDQESRSMRDDGTDSGMAGWTGPIGTDAGMTAMCADIDCAGGERCVSGRCRRLALHGGERLLRRDDSFEGMRRTSARATRVSQREVCDTATGHCVP
jgi:hypothetical protein